MISQFFPIHNGLIKTDAGNGSNGIGRVIKASLSLCRLIRDVDIMTARKKILVVGITAVLFLVFWMYWSPRALVSGNLPFQDLSAIRWLIRTQTLQPILNIYQDADGTVEVHTGVQRAPLNGSGNFFELKCTNGVWIITASGNWIS